MRDLIFNDKDRIKQILINFTSNALKYTNRGEVIVKAENIEDDEENILLTIKDTGIGIK